MLYEITSGDISVKINDVGAEIKSVVYRGEERSWQNENGKWAATSPILFPVCGNTSVKIAEKNYGMPFHGFARTRVFFCEDISDDQVIFVLKSNEETFAVYPYIFELKIIYKVCNDSIHIINEIKNESKKPMPFAIGRHDSFMLKSDVNDYKLCFSCEEEFLSRKTDKQRRLVNFYTDFGRGKELNLPKDYLSDDRTIILGGIKSDRVTLKTLYDRPVAEYSFDGIRNLLVWRPDNAKMLCLEPWSALPDSTNEENEDFPNKTRLSVIDVGDTKRIAFKITYF